MLLNTFSTIQHTFRKNNTNNINEFHVYMCVFVCAFHFPTTLDNLIILCGITNGSTAYTLIPSICFRVTTLMLCIYDNFTGDRSIHVGIFLKTSKLVDKCVNISVFVYGFFSLLKITHTHTHKSIFSWFLSISKWK